MAYNREMREAYLPEMRLVERGVKKVGVGVFLVDLETGLVCTVLEKKAKAETGRKANDISLLLETRKVHESVLDNVVGAMEEVRPLQEDEQLVWVDGVSYKGRYSLVPNVLGDLCVVGLRSRKTQADKFSCDEVISGGWWRLDDLVTQKHLRVGVERFVRMGIEYNWVDEFVGIVKSGRKVRTYDKDQVERYLEARQVMIDWVGGQP